MITITEMYIEGAEVTNIETKNFEQNREFMSKHFGNMEEKTEIPSTKGFTFSVSGVLAEEDSTHVTFLDIPKEPINIEYYLGRKGENFGFTLPVYVENCSVGHTGGEAVEIDVTFKEAGPATRIEAGK